MIVIDKQNNRHTISPQTHIIFIIPRSKKSLGRCHKSGTGNNQGRRRTTPRDNRGLTATTVTQRATSFHYQWYLFLFHWIFQSSIHLSCPRFVNSYPGLHLTVHVIKKCLDSNHINSRSNDPCLFSEHHHQVILEKIEARENLNHDEYVEEDDYYNVYSDEYDIDAN